MVKKLSILALMLITALSSNAQNPSLEGATVKKSSLHLKGDMNDDGIVDVTDIMNTVSTILSGNTSTITTQGDDYILYNTTGNNTDGAMTQKAVTEALEQNADPIKQSLDITWNTDDKYYNEKGNLVSYSGYNNATVDVTAYQGKKISIYVWMGGMVCSLFKDADGTILTKRKGLSSGTWETTIPATATTLCLSHSRSKFSGPYAKVTTSYKLANTRITEDKTTRRTISVPTKVGDVSPKLINPQLNGQYAITDYISLHGATTVLFPDGGNTTNICFYDDKRVFISGVYGTSATVPANAAYFVSRAGPKTKAGKNYTFVLEGAKEPGYSELTTTDRLVTQMSSFLYGKKIGYLGDSVTDPNFQGHWVRLLSQMLGTTAKNVALSGKRYAYGEIASQAAKLDGDEDLVIIFAGVNDYGHKSPLAPGAPFIETNGVRTATTGNSTAAGVHATIRAIYDKCGFIPIVIMTPLQRPGLGETNGSSWAANSKGYYMDDYISVIKSVAEYYSIPVLDLFHTCNLPAPLLGKGKYFSDHVHPLIIVHEMMAKRMYKFLMQVMDRW
jgi:lysophospholipase L1-like esterase